MARERNQKVSATERSKRFAPLDRSYVFLSYCRKDSAKAKKIVEILTERYIDVFWDEDIRVGDDYRARIKDKIDAAAFVVVLWSLDSANSDFVLWEADAAREQGKLIEACLDQAKLPAPFGVRSNIVNLARWRGGPNNPQIGKLIDTLGSRVRSVTSLEREYLLAPPLRGQAITDSHIALIHTCWRVPEYDDWFDDAEAYRWDVALYGSRQALDRVEEVVYKLHPAYDAPEEDPPSFAENRLNKLHRKTCFRLRQIASGHSLARAVIRISGQRQLLKLSRYINLFDSPASIKDYRM